MEADASSVPLHRFFGNLLNNIPQKSKCTTLIYLNMFPEQDNPVHLQLLYLMEVLATIADYYNYAIEGLQAEKVDRCFLVCL